MAAKSRGTRRLMQELSQLQADPPSDFFAAPLEDDLFHWHFTLKLGQGEFAGGMYHGRITLPPEYPLRPPELYMMTPNGRFELNKRICLSITGYHEDQWSPSWGIRLALTSLAGFFLTEAKGAIGGIDAPAAERKRLAKLSPEWTCPTCGSSNTALLASQPAPSDSQPSATDTPRVEPESVTVVPPPAIEQTPVAPASEVAVALPPVPSPRREPAVAPRTGIAEVAVIAPPLIVAGAMAPSPPTLLDRLTIIIIVAFLGLLVRQVS